MPPFGDLSDDDLTARLNQALPVGENPFTTAEALAVAQLLKQYRSGLLAVKQVFPKLIAIIGQDRAQHMIGEMETEYERKAKSTRYFDPADMPTGMYGTDDNSAQIMICAVCEQHLNRFDSADSGTVWIHPRAFGDEYDHEPAPKLVPRSSKYNTTCDFCGLTVPLFWKYKGDRLRAEVGNTINDMGTTWGACEPCGQLLNDGEIGDLATRVLRVGTILTKGMNRSQIDVMRNQLLDMWYMFLPTVTETYYIGPQREPAALHARMMPKLQAGLIKFWRSPLLADNFSKNQETNNLTFSLPGVHCGDEEQFIIPFEPGTPIPVTYWHNHVQHLTAGIEGADLYWISRDFTQLAIMAGKDFDKLVISREELPAKFGFLMYDSPIYEIQRPLGVARVRGVTWTLVPNGIWLNLYIQGEDGDPNVDVEHMRAEFGWLACPNVGAGIMFNEELDLGVVDDEDDAHRMRRSFIRTIFATWFLMQQPGVAESSAAPVDKKLARAYQRSHGHKLPDVKLVDLRRQKSRGGSEDTQHEGRKLTVRVYRAGHWKRQAYGPKRGMRKTIYISPYIAGPEGAPLKDRPTVVKVLR